MTVTTLLLHMLVTVDWVGPLPPVYNFTTQHARGTAHSQAWVCLALRSPAVSGLQEGAWQQLGYLQDVARRRARHLCLPSGVMVAARAGGRPQATCL